MAFEFLHWLASTPVLAPLNQRLVGHFEQLSRFLREDGRNLRIVFSLFRHILNDAFRLLNDVRLRFPHNCIFGLYSIGQHRQVINQRCIIGPTPLGLIDVTDNRRDRFGCCAQPIQP